MKRIMGLLVSVAVLSFAVPAMSQDKADKLKPEKEKQQAAEDDKKTETGEKDPSKLYVDLSALMYMEWAYFSGFKYTGSTTWGKVARWGFLDDAYLRSGDPADIVPVERYNYKKNDNTFRMQRCYLTVKKRIGEIFSLRITTDIDPSSADLLYLKYGYVQLYKDFSTPVGPVIVKAQFGKIGTPVIGITDKLSDLRWIGPNYLNNSKMVLNGKSFDDSADLGGLVSLSLFNLVTMEYTLTNGEGVKSDNNETYGGKAHTFLFSVNPVDYIKELYVNFYFRLEDTNKNKLTGTGTTSIIYTGIERRGYYGVGAAWESDLIKVGGNFFMPEMQNSRSFWYDAALAPYFINFAVRHKLKYYLVDAWFNINLGAVTPAGVLLLGRAAWGKELSSFAGNMKQPHETLVLGGGVGYQFSQYFRMVLYYETVRYKVEPFMNLHDRTKKNPTPNNNVYVKAEVKF
jgi:hypothetical protein